MRAPAFFLWIALALAGCDEIVGIEPHVLAGDGAVDGGASSSDTGSGTASDAGADDADQG